MKEIKIKANKNSIKVLFIVLTILLALPYVVYFIKEKGLANYWGYRDITKIGISNVVNGIYFICIFGLISLLYIVILKNYKKIFENKKEICKYIIIVSILFSIILPVTSTDIFYYISTGWSEAKYGVNPYYTSVYELKKDYNITDDNILNKMPVVWQNQKIVYGPVWPFICKILTSFSFGSLSVSLIIFKTFNLVVHLLNCKLIDKISNKKLFTLIYALNPLILFETLTNVHNDALLVFFILLAIYLVTKKKNIVLSVIALAVATAIKYVAILVVPFVVIYHYRKEKVLKRILNALWLAIIFIITILGLYLLYTKDLQVIEGIFVQQGKYANSLSLVLLYTNLQFAIKYTTVISWGFIIVFTIETIISLLKRNVSLRKNLRLLYFNMLAFIFLVITNFQVWYIMWLFPIIMYQSKENVKSIMNLSIASELAFSVYLIMGENVKYGPQFVLAMTIMWVVFNLININKFIEIE